MNKKIRVQLLKSINYTGVPRLCFVRQIQNSEDCFGCFESKNCLIANLFKVDQNFQNSKNSKKLDVSILVDIGFCNVLRILKLKNPVEEWMLLVKHGLDCNSAY